MARSTQTEALNLYCRDVRNIQLLTPEEECEIVKKIEAGDKEAKAKLIVSNLRLVMYIAKSLVKKLPNKLLTYEDLIGYGNIGLLVAAEKYDSQRVGKFSTFATLCIRQAIVKAILLKTRHVHIPVEMIKKIYEIQKIKNRFMMEKHREPTDEELSNITGISIDKLNEIYIISQEEWSLDLLIDAENERALIERIPDLSCVMPEVNAEEKHDEEKLINLVIKKLKRDETISERDIQIFLLRMGIVGNKEWSEEACAKKFKITKVRVGQIVARICQKLSYTKEIRAFVEYKNINAQKSSRLDAKNDIQAEKRFMRLLQDVLHNLKQVQIFRLKMGYADGREHSIYEIASELKSSSEAVAAQFESALMKIIASGSREEIIAYDNRLEALLNDFESKHSELKGEKQKV